jgi:hypothetical protein
MRISLEYSVPSLREIFLEQCFKSSQYGLGFLDGYSCAFAASAADWLDNSAA